jgi:hypothetical protein
MTVYALFSQKLRTAHLRSTQLEGEQLLLQHLAKGGFLQLPA